MAKEVITTHGAPAAIGPYSQGIKANGFVFASGQIGREPATTEIVSGGIEAETERAILNLKAVLEAAGSSLDKVVRVEVNLTSMTDFGGMNKAYARYFGEASPARTTVSVASLPKDARVEIALTALAD